MILAIESSTRVCSVVFGNDEGTLFEKRTTKRGEHSEKMFVFIEELVREHDFGIGDLDAVLVSEGPGSYTGLRISASAVKGLLFQADVPLYRVNTLLGFARTALDEANASRRIHAVIDARRVHLYHQEFEVENGVLETRSEVGILPLETVGQRLIKGDTIIGTGMKRLDNGVLQGLQIMDYSYISAKSLVQIYNESQHRSLIQQVKPEQFEPRYYSTGQVRQ